MSDTTAAATLLETVYRGWDGYNTSLVRAIAPLSPEQLAFRPAPNLQSVGEIARHIAGGRRGRRGAGRMAGGHRGAVSRQWTIWRIMAHDIQHGGQLTVLLYLQGIEPLELGYLGGHLTEPPLAEPA